MPIAAGRKAEGGAPAPTGGMVEKETPSTEERGLAQLYKDAGANVSTFHGVPVFQAEGLTVKTEKHRYTPLFFSKDDLDAALGNARNMEGRQQEEALRVKAARAAEDLEAAKAAVRLRDHLET